MAIADEIQSDIVAHGIDLLRLQGRERRQVLAILKRLEIDLVAAIQGIDPAGPLQATYRQQRAARLLRQTQETIRSAYRDASSYMAGELLEVADVEAAFARGVINRNVGFDIADASLTRQQLRAIASNALIEGAPSREWWSRQAGDMRERFADAIRQGMAAGETNADLVRRVRGTATGRQRAYWQGPDGDLSAFPLEGYRRRQFVQFAGGIMDTSTRNAEALVRTSVQAVANAARQEAYKANRDIIKAQVVVATLDSRTSDICIARSGLEYTLDGEPIGHDIAFDGGPPFHYNCRTTMAPVLKSASEVFGRAELDEVPESTRASMDGQVPESTTFDAFLGRQTKAFQDDLLGAGRAELWRDGRITLTDLLDQTGRPLTLAELRQRAGV